MEEPPPAAEEVAIPEDVILPCGCVLRCSIEAGERTLTVIPCHLSCKNLKDALDLNEAKGNNLEFREV